MEGRYLCGAIPSPPDDRDYSVRVLAPVALPVSYRQAIKKNYDQIAGNCVSQTFRNFMRSAYGIEFGVDMLYGGARSHNSPGLYPIDAARFLSTYGIAPAKVDRSEREVTEVIDYYAANRTKLENAAAPYAGATYARAYTAAEIKAALYSGLYVAGCFAISQYACRDNGIFPCTEARLGYHEMRIFGWDIVDGVEYACVQNSWGEKWGKAGECYVSWTDVLRTGDILIFSVRKKENRNDGGGAMIRRTLKRGMRDGNGYNDVTELQTKLKASGNHPGSIDGSFGSMTRSAVKCFQRAHRLEDDGIVGRKTWEVLDTYE